MEIWKNVEGYEGLYQVSNKGRIKSLARYKANQWTDRSIWMKERILSTQLTNDGYPTTKLSKDGKSIRHRVHRLVAKAFIENIDNKPQVNHINSVKSDNNECNLEWCTQIENMKHACENGLKSTKLTTQDIIKIRSDDRTLLAIAKDFDIAFQTVSEIKNRKIWNWM